MSVSRNNEDQSANKSDGRYHDDSNEQNQLRRGSPII